MSPSMSHISLYRKYRPATFAEVVGQGHVTRTLTNAIESGKISHAYLFAGSRGTGKTSTAKLLAKALNCAEGPAAEPCGKCESCVSVGAGTSLDVIEMDAASNRGIDDIRDIRDKVAFSPVEGRYKVYILDEAHMLTKEASNAFLKVLEEPPAHVIFVLCTTEAHKVIPTIQSRCQRFEFRRPDSNMVLEVLKRIAASEKIDIDDAGLTAIARGASGSFRDAIGILDQLSTYCDKKVSLTDVLSMLGTVEADLLFEAADIVAGADTRAAILLVSRMAEQGRDFSQFAGELISHFRNIFLLQQLGDDHAGVIDAPGEDIARLKGQARMLAPHQVLRFVELLSEAQTAIKQGSDPRLQLELAFITMTRPAVDRSTRSLLYRLELLESGGAAVTAPPASSMAVGAAGAAGAGAQASDSGEAAATEAAADVAAGAREGEAPGAGSVASGPEPAGPAAAGLEANSSTSAETEKSAPDAAGPEAASGSGFQEVTLDKITRAWSVITAQVKKKKIPLYSQLNEARPVELNGGTLVIAFPPEAEFHRTQVERPENAAVITGVLKEITGTVLRVKCITGEGAGAAPEKENGPPSAEEVIALLKEEMGAEEIQ